MPELIDQYFLVDRRDALFVTQFLDRYLPEREPTSADYFIPSINNIDGKDIEIVLKFYEHYPNEKEIIYLTNLDVNSLITHAILSYTDDAKMVLGISAIGNYHDLRENLRIHYDIKSFLNTTITCMTVETPPPTNSIEFIEFAKLRSRFET
ncbi:hypothetical protein SIO70_15820 [Chitinophaga sancti]|uniref:hypothetical protein n=1 Tax=Chitinophaga sancti TaxID=1004 RepID=UPI002A7517EA|nr:hypothetical protein [Chitinophaga sancti]WPQ66326.1 hypothetical protein SIO70_15820 [Chitinophaga sancti]